MHDMMLSAVVCVASLPPYRWMELRRGNSGLHSRFGPSTQGILTEQRHDRVETGQRGQARKNPLVPNFPKEPRQESLSALSLWSPRRPAPWRSRT